MSSILKIRDENGNFIDIPAIKGDKGKSAYEQAVEGGYKGTEQEFSQGLIGLPTATGHTTSKDNPHNVTAEQVGALPIVGGTLSNNLHIKRDSGGITSLLQGSASEKIAYSDFHMTDKNDNFAKIRLQTIGTDGKEISLDRVLLFLYKGKDASTHTSYRLYGEHNKPTAKDVGALPLTGGTIDGPLSVKGLSATTFSIKPEYYKEPIEIGENIDFHRIGSTSDYDVRLSIDESGNLIFYPTYRSQVKRIFGEHNKPTGTYTGNDKARTIDIGGIGSALMITSSAGVTTFVTSFGAICLNYQQGTLYGFTQGDANFTNGVLNISTVSHLGLNYNGFVYTYQVL